MKAKRIFSVLAAAFLFGTMIPSLVSCGKEESSKPKQEPYAAKQLSNESDYEKVFYVSGEAGDDTAAGTYDAPFKTLEKAKEAVDAANNNMQKDIAVVVRRGTYSLQETFVLNNKDCGTNGHSVVYMGYPDEEVSLSGGVKLSNWKKDGDKYYTSVKASEIRDMWVNGERAILARSPNKKNYTQGEFEWTEISSKYRRVNKMYAKNEDLKGATSFEAVCYMEWSESIVKVESVTKAGDHSLLNVRSADASAFFGSNWVYPQVQSNPYMFFQNAKEFLDQEGEFFYDDSEERLYYIPRRGEDMSNAEIYVSNIETVVSVSGESLYSPVQGIRFENLAVEHNSEKTVGKQGFREVQASHYLDSGNGIMGAAVVVDNAINVGFENCKIRHTGSGGLLFLSGVSHSEIRGNAFYDTAAYAITVAPDATKALNGSLYPKEREPLICHDIDIDNNYVTWSGMVYPRSAAIASMHGYNINITNNEVGWVSYTGISVGWGWSLNAYHARNNLIARNDVHNYGQYGSDLGGIYTLNNQPGTVIEENYVHECASILMGMSDASCTECLYLDEGSDNMIVRRNQFAYASNKRDTIMYHIAGDNIVEEDNKAALQGDQLDQTIIDAAGPQGEYKKNQPYLDADGGAKVFTSGGRQTSAEGGTYGYKMEPEEDMTVYGLGRFFIKGNNQKHKLSVYDSKKKLITSCTVDMLKGNVDEYGYKYARFKKPLAMKKGEQYFIVSEEFEDGDMYLFKNTSLRIEGVKVLGIVRTEKLTFIRDNINSTAFIGINLLLK